MRKLLLAFFLCLASAPLWGQNASAPDTGLQPPAIVGQSAPAVVRPSSPPADTGWMSPERRELAIEYSDTKNKLYFFDNFYSFLVLGIILFTGFSAYLWKKSEALGKKRFFAFVIFIFLFILVTTILSFPLAYYSGFHLEHKYQLSKQSFGAWMGDFGKGFLLNWIITLIIVWFLYLVLRRFPRRWWLGFALGSLPFLIFFVVIAPVVISPLFNKFTPLQNEQLRDKILAQAERAGISGGRVFEMDASKQTEKANAYVTGLFNTKRIVLFDTMIKKFAEDEMLFVLGHEMGHYVLNHIWYFVWLTFLVILLFGYLGNKFMHRLIARFKDRFGFSELSHPASLALIVLVFSIFSFFFSPIINGYSRHIEHEADVFGLNQTQNGDAAARAFQKLADQNLSNPNPSKFIKFWLYGHPPLSERVEFARKFDAEKAAKNQTSTNIPVESSN